MADKACGALQRYLKIAPREGFTSFDFRKFASVTVPMPPDERAWGPVLMRSAKAGQIRRIGFKTHQSPSRHCAPAAIWIKTSEG